MISRYFVLVLFLNLSFISLDIYAEKADDIAALNGVTLAKSVFLIDFTNPRKTAFYLDIIKGTHEGLMAQGVESDMILVFIGQTVQYLSIQPDDDLVFEYEAELESIQNSIKQFAKLGVRMEVCAIATRVFGIDNDLIPKEMHIVDDGFISLIGWQTQGYKLVPIF